MRFDDGDWVVVTAGDESGRVGQILRIASEQASYSGGRRPDHLRRSYVVELRLPGGDRRTVTSADVQLRLAARDEIAVAEQGLVG
jgi:hypothetical protein